MIFHACPRGGSPRSDAEDRGSDDTHRFPPPYSPFGACGFFKPGGENGPLSPCRSAFAKFPLPWAPSLLMLFSLKPALSPLNSLPQFAPFSVVTKEYIPRFFPSVMFILLLIALPLTFSFRWQPPDTSAGDIQLRFSSPVFTPSFLDDPQPLGVSETSPCPLPKKNLPRGKFSFFGGRFPWETNI